MSRRPDPPALGLAVGGFRVVRLTSEPRCKCCRPEIRDKADRWLLLQKSGELEADGSQVTFPWMVKESLPRLGLAIGEQSWDNHRKKHIRIVRDTTAEDLQLSDHERVRQEVEEARGEDGQFVRQVTHEELLQEIVQIGAAKIRANPDLVSVDQALAAAKELGRLKVDDARAKLLQALAQSADRRPAVPPPADAPQIPAEVPVDAEFVELPDGG